MSLEPCAKEHLAEIAEEHARGVVECAVVEDLVVQEVVREPAALLPEKRLRQSSSQTRFTSQGRRNRHTIKQAAAITERYVSLNASSARERAQMARLLEACRQESLPSDGGRHACECAAAPSSHSTPCCSRTVHRFAWSCAGHGSPGAGEEAPRRRHQSGASAAYSTPGESGRRRRCRWRPR